MDEAMSRRWVVAVSTILVVCGCSSADRPPGQGSGSSIGPAGGTVSSPSGAQVVVPAGGLSAPALIAVTQSGSGAPALPAGVVAFGPIFAFTPHGTTFATPATITVPFDSGERSRGLDADPLQDRCDPDRLGGRPGCSEQPGGDGRRGQPVLVRGRCLQPHEEDLGDEAGRSRRTVHLRRGNVWRIDRCEGDLLRQADLGPAGPRGPIRVASSRTRLVARSGPVPSPRSPVTATRPNGPGRGAR